MEPLQRFRNVLFTRIVVLFSICDTLGPVKPEYLQ
jgi:hypothetical protein